MEQRRGAGIVFALALAPLALGAEWQRFEAVEPHMGTLVSIRLYAKNTLAANRAFEKAFARIHQLDEMLSDYKPSSEVSRLRSGPAQPVSKDLYHLLDLSQRIARDSGGAFDVTIGALTSQWRAARKQGRLLTPDETQDALNQSGYAHLKVAAGKVALARQGMKLDLGGIAKGYAAQQALAVLQREGIHRALVAVSGDLAIGQAPPNQPGWRIEIARRKVLTLHHCAISTSGSSEQRLEKDGRIYSHIVDPRTGHPLETASEVTVIGPDGAIVDAVATAISVLGQEAGTALAHRYRTQLHLVP